jgi:radical SAM superfamily enzyme YgiQ (UPF0313 family)
MSEIVLATINARFIHASAGLRYLFANLGDLQSCAQIIEFENVQSAKEIVEVLVQANPRIVGLGVYIWNAERTREVLSMLRKIRPEIVIVLGGPEISYEYGENPIFALCDYLITGEGDVAFPTLCRAILAGTPPSEKVIAGGLPNLDEVQLPYPFYTDADIAHRVIYVEVSRGCPFSCEFCLSSVDLPVRQFDHQRVLVEIERLFARGARTFKFVDRTFNLNVRTSASILQFFLDRMEPGVFVHFEMVPDRFPTQLRELVAKFPPGSLQLEIGVQTLNPHVSGLISRRQDVPKLFDNLQFLRTQTHAYLHVDLIVGLPGESIESFAQGFDKLVKCNPQEIQVGILKRLRGTPIVRHTEEYGLRFSDDPPYEVLETRDVTFLDMQRMERFARYWDLVANSGNFVRSRDLIWEGTDSPCVAFLEFSDWLFGVVGRRSSIQLKALTEHLFRFLTEVRGLHAAVVGPLLADDYQRGGRSDLPRSLKRFAESGLVRTNERVLALKRQQRVLEG